LALDISAFLYYNIGGRDFTAQAVELPSNGQVLPQPGRSFLSWQTRPYFYSEINILAAMKKSSACVALLRRTSDIFHLAQNLDFSLRKRAGLPRHLN